MYKMDMNLDVRDENGLLPHYGTFEKHCFGMDPEESKLWLLHVIANELAEANRLKRFELTRLSGNDGEYDYNDLKEINQKE